MRDPNGQVLACAHCRATGADATRAKAPAGERDTIPARKTMPAKDLHELIAWLKANPNKASVAVVTVGARLLATVFQMETGTQFVLVPYRGPAPAMQDLVAGHIDLLFFDLPLTSLPCTGRGKRRQTIRSES